MNKKKILILGANGFIGKNLTNFFSKNLNYEVYANLHDTDDEKAMDGYLKSLFEETNPKIKVTELTHKQAVDDLFETVRPDIVLQYAAYTTNSKDVVESPYNHSTINYCINALVLEAAHKVGVKHFIYPSCATMYESSENPKSESDWSLDTIPKQYSHVAYMKTAVERMMKAYSEMDKCKYTVIRQSNVFGPYDKTDLNLCHVFNAMVNKVVNAKDSIEVWGDPVNQAKRDLIYVDDVVNMVDLVIQKQETPYEIFNCGAGEAYSINQIIAMITSILNKRIDIIYNKDKPNIPTCTILNCDKAKRMLRWEPLVPFKTGVKETLEWYKNNK